jgi:GTP-binding protein
MKTIADLGFVGFPNAGKSSLTRILTSARPKVAPYPFTTLHANVGVIEYPDRHGRVFLADIPGLIEGASENRGLGHRFLKHIERCTLLIFLLDMAGSEGRKPLSDYKVLERELRLYSKILAAKPRLVVANKMDLPGAEANLATFRAKVATPIVPVSCLSGSGLDELREVIWKAVKVRPLSTAEPKADKPAKAKVKAITRKTKPTKAKPTKSKSAKVKATKVKSTKVTKVRPVARKSKPLRRKAGR